MSEVYPVRGIFERVKLGCKQTLIKDVENCCQSELEHLCSEMELLQGGFRVAKMMGWVDNTGFVDLWQHEDINTVGED